AMFNKSAPAQPGSEENTSNPPASMTQQPTAIPAADSAVSTIAQDMKITGDLTCNGVVRVEGQIEGSIKGARQVFIGRQGMVKGDVNAKEAIIAGKIEGSVSASERVEV